MYRCVVVKICVASSLFDSTCLSTVSVTPSVNVQIVSLTLCCKVLHNYTLLSESGHVMKRNKCKAFPIYD